MRLVKPYALNATNKIHFFINPLMGFVASRLFLRITIVWFFIQALFMALSTRFGIAPDEAYHFAYIQLFAKNGWLPFIHDQTGYYFIGEVSKTPFFLYHYLLSLPFHFFGNSPHAYIILRLFNICLVGASLYFAYRIATILKFSNLVKNLGLFMLINTLMFVFLSASINYDNLFVLLSLSGFYLLLRLLDEPRVSDFLLLGFVTFAGLLTKLNFLSIAFAFFLVVIWMVTTKRLDLFALLAKVRQEKTRVALVSLPLLLVLFLFSQRYLVNLAHYHTPTPQCNLVNTQQQCEQFSVYARNETLYGGGPHPSSVSATEYGGTWVANMRERTFGILGQQNIPDNALVSAWSQILIIVTIYAFARFYRYYDSPKVNMLIIISVVYILSLALTNYRTYILTGMVGISVQGRYGFAVLPIAYLLGIHFVLKMLKNHQVIMSTFIIITLIVFTSAGLPSYLALTDDTWYTQPTAHINHKLHDAVSKTYQFIKP